MENNNNKFLLGIIAVLLVVAIGLGAYVAYDKGIIFKNEDNNQNNNIQENNNQENNTKENVVSVSLVDPSTENLSDCPAKDINDSKYLQKQSDGTYVANLTLENALSAFQEYYYCDFAPYYGGKVRYNVSAKYGNNNMNFNVLTSDSAYGVFASINNDAITAPSFYTFNNEYLVVAQGSTNTTGPARNDGVYIFDKNGNKVFESKDITLDIYDENRNLKKEIKYKKICEGAWDYYECENIISGEIKYDTVNKKFIVKEETVKYTN